MPQPADQQSLFSSQVYVCECVEAFIDSSRPAIFGQSACIYCPATLCYWSAFVQRLSRLSRCRETARALELHHDRRVSTAPDLARGFCGSTSHNCQWVITCEKGRLSKDERRKGPTESCLMAYIRLSIASFYREKSTVCAAPAAGTIR